MVIQFLPGKSSVSYLSRCTGVTHDLRAYLEIGIHDNFLLVSVLERFAAFDRMRQQTFETLGIDISVRWGISASCDRRTPFQS